MRDFLAVFIAVFVGLASVTWWEYTRPPERNLTKAYRDELGASYLEIATLSADLNRVFKRPLGTPYKGLAQRRVTITAYSARVQECDSTPELTADSTPSRIGLLAVSRDLLEVFDYGDRVLLEDYGIFEVRDTMNERFTDRVDILHATPEAARLFGKQEGRLMWPR
jgi:3D (Asp-Asp-Asp) domain-containing protein